MEVVAAAEEAARRDKTDVGATAAAEGPRIMKMEEREEEGEGRGRGKAPACSAGGM